MLHKILQKFLYRKKLSYDFSLPDLKRRDLTDVQKSYVRAFATTDGQEVLNHLQRTTFFRVLPSDSQDKDIRYIEGQRAVVAQIMRHIAAGKE